MKCRPCLGGGIAVYARIHKAGGLEFCNVLLGKCRKVYGTAWLTHFLQDGIGVCHEYGAAKNMNIFIGIGWPVITAVN
jgi:hypothetical protein